ncbi:hypothetical protein Cha6605_1209 [Chamaesiphon minutus PCC 6605]|uniref:Uncharacterized protein n=1 Tax=Chamaesiphon minutus (strain ATCC 27169 / PCC 6605) TaxID=1173020 RepID=K9UDZ5_CHAP6|nr:hypothetical protein Cha6605_1209 [Chamaesiphon minutus PCC 6605]
MSWPEPQWLVINEVNLEIQLQNTTLLEDLTFPTIPG